MSLSSLIVERGIASIREIEEALARQVLYGGDLVTNLLEVSRIEESALMPIVAESFGLPMAPNGELPRAPEGTGHVVAAEVAAQHGFAPLTVGVQLVVAVAAPLTPDAEQELSFALAMRIQQRIAPIFRIRQALARDFGVPFDKRTARLIQKIVLKGPRIASTFPPPMGSEPLDPFTPPRTPSRIPPPPKLPTVAPVTAASPGTLLRNVELAPPASLRPARRRRGPLTLEAATTELEASAERDAVFDIVFEFARQFFDYTVLFGVHGEGAEGRDAFGDGLSHDKVARLTVPFDAPSLIVKARATLRTVRSVPSKEGVDAILMADLGRDGTTECAVFPVVVRKRVVALLFGDGGASGLDDEGVRSVERLVIAAAGAFERVIVRRKLKAGDAPAEGGARAAMKKAESIAPPPIESAPPIRLSTGPFSSLDLPIPILPRIEMPEDGPAIEELAAPIRELMSDPTPFPLDVDTLRDPTGELSGMDQSFVAQSDLPPPANILAVRRPSGAPIPREEPKERSLVPRVTLPPEQGRTKSGTMQRAEAPLLEFGTPSMPSVISENGFGGEAGEQSLLAQIQGVTIRNAISEPPPPQTTRDGGPPSLEWPLTSTVETEAFSSPKASSPPPASVALLTSLPPDDRFDADRTPIAPAAYDPDLTPLMSSVEPVLSLSHRKGAPPRIATQPMGRPMPPSEQQVSVPAHKPPSKREPDEELPSIIVDIASEYTGLVDRVLAGNDEDAETELLRAGGYAMPAIMAKFPGPITIEPERLEGPLPRIAEVGPILRLIAGQRRTALPFVVGDVTSLDSDRRFWATYLLTELVYPDAVEPAVGRVFDENARVRKAARTAVRALAEAHPTSVVAQLAAILGNERKRGLHVKAVEALGESREPSALPLILPLLDGNDAEIAAATRTALVTISRQDFNLDGARWAAWWEANKGRHRLEWLIDSLMHEHRSLRGAASDELRTQTKEYFAYYDDLPKRERAAAQIRYREWWENVGKIRFSRAGQRGA